jgi:hypothetical protein
MGSRLDVAPERLQPLIDYLGRRLLPHARPLSCPRPLVQSMPPSPNRVKVNVATHFGAPRLDFDKDRLPPGGVERSFGISVSARRVGVYGD